MSGKRWKVYEISLLRRRAREGLNCYEVAEELGRPYYATKTKAGRLGIKFKQSSAIRPEQRGKIIDYLIMNPGSTMSDARNILNRYPQTLCHMCRTLQREGLLIRLGSKCGNVRYIVAKKWFTDVGRGKLAEYEEYIKQLRDKIPSLLNVSEDVYTKE